MLIRFGEELKELPDAIAVAILANSSIDDDLTTLTTHDINVIVHGCLGVTSISDSFEDSLRDWQRMYSGRNCSESRKLQAQELIEKYEREIKPADVGMIPFEDMF
jgi:hypothetical protein